jgi:hypothetical protein
MRLKAVLALVIGCGDGGGDGSNDPNDTNDPGDADGDGVAAPDDCNDDDGAVFPGAEELCNGKDDNCAGGIDEDPVDGTSVYSDADGDGFGGATENVTCHPANGAILVGGDCNDSNVEIHPDADELCNDGIDDDCDGNPDDEDDDVVDGSNWYDDADGDGFGAGSATKACEPPDGFVADHTDCADGDGDVNPGAEEICDGVDDDCNGNEDGVVSIGNVAYASIQDALDDATSGATVMICEGTFRESLSVTRDVTLEGRGASESEIDADAGGSGIGVVTFGVDLTVRSLTIRNGVGQYVSALALDAGGGIEASSAGSLVVEDCVIEDNTTTLGAGILGPFDGDVEIAGSTIRNNTATYGAGGGVELTTSPGHTIRIVDTEISGNQTDWNGGGLAILAFDLKSLVGSASIEGTVIDGNVGTSVDSVGGGLISAASLDLSDVTISGNECAQAAGAFVFGDTTADDTTTISGNRAVDYGGGIFVSGATWSGGHIEDNDSDYGGGGVVLVDATLSDAMVEGNRAVSFGGGVLAYFDTAIEASTIDGNTAGVGGGGVLFGGDLKVPYSGVVDSCTITSNTAAGGAGAQAEIEMQSIATDWGTSGTDNSPDDVLFYYDPVGGASVDYSGFGASEDFVCNVAAGICG